MARKAGWAGQPAPERVAAVRSHVGRDVGVQAEEVFGQRKLLKWTVPGVAHFFTFWGFIILIFTIVEAYGDLFSRSKHLHIFLAPVNVLFSRAARARPDQCGTAGHLVG